MTNFDRCKLCDKLIPESRDGKAAHMKQYHNVNLRMDVTRYTPEEKARIVAKGEERIGLQHFIETTTVSPALIEKALAPGIPATFCLVTEDVCVWEKYGMELCGPCQIRKEYLATVPIAIEEVKYID